jgi:hypothetical protein
LQRDYTQKYLIEEVAAASPGMPLADLDAVRRDAVAAIACPRRRGRRRARSRGAQCYYRDVPVLRSLGLELRPPFPKGYRWSRAIGRCSIRSRRVRRWCSGRASVFTHKCAAVDLGSLADMPESSGDVTF